MERGLTLNRKTVRRQSLQSSISSSNRVIIKEVGSGRRIQMAKTTHFLKVIACSKNKIKYCCFTKTIIKPITHNFDLVRITGNHFTIKDRKCFSRLKLVLTDLLVNHIDQHWSSLLNSNKKKNQVLPEDKIIETSYLEIINTQGQKLIVELKSVDIDIFVLKSKDSCAKLIEILTLKGKPFSVLKILQKRLCKKKEMSIFFWGVSLGGSNNTPKRMKFWLRIMAK